MFKSFLAAFLLAPAVVVLADHTSGIGGSTITTVRSILSIPNAAILNNNPIANVGHVRRQRMLGGRELTAQALPACDWAPYSALFGSAPAIQCVTDMGDQMANWAALTADQTAEFCTHDSCLSLLTQFLAIPNCETGSGPSLDFMFKDLPCRQAAPVAPLTPVHTPCTTDQVEISVETVDGVFCVAKSETACSGDDPAGVCPAANTLLPFGSFCGRVRSGVYGCKPFLDAAGTQPTNDNNDTPVQCPATAEGEYSAVSVEGAGTYCALQPVCSGSIHGNCPTADSGLGQTATCKTIHTGVFGCSLYD